MSRIDELPPGQPQNEPRKLVPENKDQQLHFALSIAEHLARTIDEERALRHGIVLDYQKLTEEHAVAVARADNTETELNAFVGDIEALIPADCRNTRPDRLASVRAAVGMMAQRLAGAEATGSKEAKRAEFNALADSVSDTPFTAPSAKDGPTEEAETVIDDIARAIYGTCRTEQERRFGRRLWQAARAGMVSTDSLRATTASRLLDAWQQMARDIGVEKWDGSIAGQSLCDATAAYIHSLRAELATAERRVGELETDLREHRKAADAIYEADRNTIANLRAELERVKAEVGLWDVWGGTHSLMGLTPAAARDSIANDLARLKANEKRTAELFRELGLGYNASDTLDSVLATIRGWRDTATAPASDEVTEAEARVIYEQFCSAHGFQLGGAWSDLQNSVRTALPHLIRLARRNHGGSATELGVAKTRIVELEAVSKSFELAMDALAQIENLCGSDQELEPDEVVELVRKTLSKPQPFTLPLTEAQREELAKIVHKSCFPNDDWGSLDEHLRRRCCLAVDAISTLSPPSGDARTELARIARRAYLNGLETWEHASEHTRVEWYRVIDAIAPRIARVGVEIPNVPRKQLLTLAVSNNCTVDYAGGSIHNAFKWEQFAADVLNEARAILAAAQGGTEPGSDALNTQYQALKQLTEDLGISGQGTFEWHFARIREAFAAQPPRGRKLTDGERKTIEARANEHRGSHHAAPEALERLCAFVESLLAPQDEVRVALGVAVLDCDDGDWMTTEPDDYGRYVFGASRFDSAITAALSASPGDKFRFAVVARRVE